MTPAEKVSKHERMLLALTALVLARAGHQVAPFGIIIHGPTYTRAKVQLPKLNNAAHRIIDEITAIIAASSKPRLILHKNCNACGFHATCQTQALESDDLSLISSLSKTELLSLHKRGLFTVTQLSHSYRPRKRRRNAKRADKHLPALKALAICKKQVYVRDATPELPKRKLDVFLDVEGLPDSDLFYLIGVKICDGKNERTYSFWADTPDDQPTIWRDFLTLIEGMSDFSLFHYGSYETRFLTKMLARYGGLGADAEKALRASLVNVLTHCHLYVYFPTYSNGLKDIARFLGFHWEQPDATGLQAIRWREAWTKGREPELKERLIRYNQQDCDALKVLTTALRDIVEHGQQGSQSVAKAEDVKASSPYGLGKSAFCMPEFEHINKCAYFDYQRTKVYWRTDKKAKKVARRNRLRLSKRKIRINRTVRAVSKKCPRCRGVRIRSIRDASKLVCDLRYGPSGVKSWTTRVLGHLYACDSCHKVFLPRAYPRARSGKRVFGHGLIAWVVYAKIEARQTDASVMNGLNDLFRLGMNTNYVTKFKTQAVEYYSRAYQEIQHAIRTGSLVQVDETKVNMRGATGYVWAFTNLVEVMYVYSESREGKILSEVLGAFRGVLVSDFYPAFDSFDCVQQRCLIHLIRDLNDDLFKNPFDVEYKGLVEDFGRLLRPIMDTIDRYGLRRRYLQKHKKEVARFFKTRVETTLESSLATKYQERFKKNEHRLFTFLDYDGVPWNNNNAENAIKGFAATRRGVEGLFTENGLKKTLKLLSISQTLRNRDASFLEFLKSGKKSLKAFLGETD
jgi:predicted RecB family nuclease